MTRDDAVRRLAAAMCQRRHHPVTPAVSCQRCFFDAEAAIDAGATMRDPPPAPPAPEIVVPEDLAEFGRTIYLGCPGAVWDRTRNEYRAVFPRLLRDNPAYLAHWLRGEGRAVADAVIRERVQEIPHGDRDRSDRVLLSDEPGGFRWLILESTVLRALKVAP